MAIAIDQPLQDAARLHWSSARAFLAQNKQVLFQVQQCLHAHFHPLEMGIQ
jgi:hypothetical protein